MGDEIVSPVDIELSPVEQEILFAAIADDPATSNEIVICLLLAVRPEGANHQ
ncbi:MAG: hypothetical protein WBX25_31760 [Rhodomicrobium sp.]